ncbi:MAG TPA: polyphosphate kinase 1 [Candidatus Omnitrophota bacterium]|nr:polyphosphate kinase 1 [Candidatus Omnitrophota bacterium]HQL40673.1 polyphosphate kinase 1 [Candidatus Omnitrophota bacterium]
MEEKNKKSMDRFIHRDISWLMFNERVLEEATDPHNPLLEQVRFLAIFANNLDEFFMVRVAGLKRLIDSQFNKKDAYGYYPQEVFERIHKETNRLTKSCYSVYHDTLRPELEKKEIYIRAFADLSFEQQKYAKRYFDNTIFPIATPMAVDPGRPFPALPSKTMALAVLLRRNEESFFAIIPIPKNLPRLVRMPSEKDETTFLLIENLIKEFIVKFFNGFDVAACFAFRLMRDSEMSGEEEYSADLLKAIASEIKKRPKAKVVCLEAEKSHNEELLEFLCQILSFDKEQTTLVNGDLDLTYLFELVAQANMPKLFYPSYDLKKMEYDNIFDRMKEGDFIIHLPFQSFQPTVDLLQAAAQDKDVLAIKMTLYRTNEDSAIIQALKAAARHKKQVTVLVEIKARFDEERNINWSKELEEAGCHVIYGFSGMKIHSKMTLIIRKEEGRIRRYVHLSTGNYNEKTARLYTDIGYFTANDDFARDISEVFNVITGYSLPSRWQRIVSAPYDLRGYFFELIDREIEYQKRSRNGLILAKMNSLEDPKMIQKLYEASCAGVKIKLLVRGICCLIPGVEGLSENIEVKSIVGRFLEHTRIYIFHNNSDERVFLSSADWMRRNLDRRVELLFEIHKQEITDQLSEQMQLYWKDNAKTRILTAKEVYVRPKETKEKFNIQEHLIRSYGG